MFTVLKKVYKSHLAFLVFLILLAGCHKYKRPDISIIYPTEGMIIGKGEIIDIEVKTSDKNGRVLQVYYIIDDVSIASSDFPHSYQWNTKGYELGSHTIKVIAYDDDAGKRSDAVTISIDISTPRVQTLEPSKITTTSAIVGGKVINDGGDNVTETGVYWGTAENVEETGTKQKISSNMVDFSTKILSLATNETYFFKAYAINTIGESLGEELHFFTFGNETGFFTDKRDNREYKWVRIGDQYWMAENLAYLPRVFPPDKGSRYYNYYYVYGYYGEEVFEAAATDNYKKYGVLYNFEAANASCPIGWHLPSEAEWIQLETTLNMDPVEATNSDWRGSTQGSELKSRESWYNNGNGTNTSDFSAFPAGGRMNDQKDFNYIEKYTYFWTSSTYGPSSAWIRSLYYNNQGVFRNTADKQRGYSVRCVKD